MVKHKFVKVGEVEKDVQLHELLFEIDGDGDALIRCITHGEVVLWLFPDEMKVIIPSNTCLNKEAHGYKLEGGNCG